ncbi:MAG TPA: AI-2E family transporter [Longimicrobiales bacterium]
MAAIERRAPGWWARLQATDLYKTAGLLAVAALLLLFFRPIFELLLAFYAAAILAVAWNPVVERLPAPRWLGAILAGLVMAAALAAFLLFLSGPLAGEVRGLRAALPALLDYVRRELAGVAGALGVDLSAPIGQPLARDAVVGVARRLVRYGFLLFLIFLGAVFFLARPNDQLLVPALRLFPEERRDVVREVLYDLAHQLRRFILALAISVSLVATAGSLMYFALDVRFPLALGILMGLGELVPFLGPTVAVTPGLLVALMDSPAKAVAVGAAWSVIQLIQSYIVWPLIVSGTARLHPALVLFGIVLFGRLFGPLGMLLTVPLLMLLGVLAYDLWIERAVRTADQSIPPMARER